MNVYLSRHYTFYSCSEVFVFQRNSHFVTNVADVGDIRMNALPLILL